MEVEKTFCTALPLAFLSTGLSIEEKSKIVLDDLVERLPENFDLEDIRSRVDEYSPYVMVAIQVPTTDAIVATEVMRLPFRRRRKG